MTAASMPNITRERFLAAVGRTPVEDELERCNCPDAGKVGHMSCGWNFTYDMPVFMVGRDNKNAHL